MAPAVVLWTDEKREWEALVPRFRQALPNFFIFGPYNAANRTGPAIWLRCVMSGKVAEISWPPTAVPILYLPGLSRVTLRATEECPNELKPLAEPPVPRGFLVPGQGQGLDRRLVLADEQRGAQAQAGQRCGHLDIDPP